jgi:hypothetical protein
MPTLHSDREHARAVVLGEGPGLTEALRRERIDDDLGLAVHRDVPTGPVRAPHQPRTSPARAVPPSQPRLRHRLRMPGPEDASRAHGLARGRSGEPLDTSQPHGAPQFVADVGECWHYALAGEPFPDTHVDFPVTAGLGLAR